MCAKMSSFSPDSLLLPHRVWKVKFVGKRILCFVPSLSQLFSTYLFLASSLLFLKDLRKGRDTVEQHVGRGMCLKC